MQVKQVSKFSKVVMTFFALVIAFAFSGAAIVVNAATREYGPDWSRYQGNYGRYGASRDTFAIAQIGGTYGGEYNDQATYWTQVAAGVAAGKRMHTYVWFQVGGSTYLANAAMNRFLPRVQTPKGSIVALDYEAGASGSVSANTTAILTGMNRIKAAGYTPMYYSYKPYTLAHVDYNRILRYYPNSLWIAAYMNYNATITPNFGYFPSMNGIAIWQFTSSYGGSGLDGNVDLTGITHRGYGGYRTTSTGKVVVKPKTTTPAVKAGQQANAIPKKAIKAGDTVKVNMNATRWANGVSMPTWVRGKTYHVSQVSGNNVLLAGIMSWINKGNVELLATPATVAKATGSSASGKEFDYAQNGTFSPSVTVNVRLGMGNQYRITGQLKSGNSVRYNHVYLRNGIVWARYQAYSGTRYVAMGVNGGQSYGSRNGASSVSVPRVSHTYYTVKSGDSFWSIGQKYGVNMYTIASRNGVSVNHVIHPGERLLIE